MFYHAKKLLLAACLLLFLFGCASGPAYQIEDSVAVGSLGSDTSITIVDERPQTDAEYSIGSLFVTSDRYGIWTLGDRQFSPPLVDLLNYRLHQKISTWQSQPDSVRIKLERMIVESNQQADLLQSVSTGGALGPLGVEIAEAMHGKEFELDYDKSRPFVLGFISADVEMSYAGRPAVTKKVVATRAENFSSHMDAAGREVAAKAVVNDIFASFVDSLND